MFRQGKARREYCRIVKSFNAAWAEICPSKPIRVRLSSAFIPFLIYFCGDAHRDKRKRRDARCGNEQLVYRQIALGNAAYIIAHLACALRGNENEVSVIDDLIHLFAEGAADGVCQQRPCYHREEHEEHYPYALKLAAVLLGIQALHPHRHCLHENNVAYADKDYADKARPVGGKVQGVFRVEGALHITDDEVDKQAAEDAEYCRECGDGRNLFVVYDLYKRY